MRAKRPLLTLFLLSGYLLIAAVIVIYLVLQASTGAFFGANERSFKVVLVQAPGINANKSEVLNPAGVRVGVVTSVQNVDSGVAVELKLTRPLPVREDGYVEVVTRSILGEKAVMLHPGSESKNQASNGATLAAASESRAEPSQALNPIAGAVDKLAPLDTGELIKQMRVQLVPVLGQVDTLLQQLDEMGGSFTDLDGAGGRVLTRMSSLMQALASSDTDLESLVSSLSLLTADLGKIVSENVDQLGDILLLTSRLTNTLSKHDQQISLVLDRLPGYLDQLTGILDTVVRMFGQERGLYFRSEIVNLPEISHWLEILEAGRGAS